MRTYVKLFLILLVLTFLINTVLLNYSLYNFLERDGAKERIITVENKGIVKEIPSVVKSKRISEDKKPVNKIVLVSSGYEEEKDEDRKKRSHRNSKKLNPATVQHLEDSSTKEESSKYIIKKGDGVETITATSSEIESMLDDGGVNNIELDQKVSLLGDTISSQIIKIKANEFWTHTKGKGVKTAILDSGISQHDELKIAGGISFVGGDYHDYFGHGTQVAGVISALLNEEGIAGTAPEADIYSIKITHTKKGDLSTAIKGLRWAIDNNMDVVVMSFGFNDYSQIFKDLVNEAYDKGVILVSAAGNDEINEIRYPAKYEDVIAVGAVDNDNIICRQ